MAGTNPQALVDDFNAGMKAWSQDDPEFIKAFSGLLGATLKDGALTVKTKELIFVGIAVALRCDYCIALHVKNAAEAGATKAELLEAGQVGIAMGGGPTLTYSVTVLQDSIKKYAK